MDKQLEINWTKSSGKTILWLRRFAGLWD